MTDRPLADSTSFPGLVDSRISASFAGVQAQLDKRVALRVQAKLFDAQGAVTAINAASFGDSLAVMEQMHMYQSLDRAMGGVGTPGASYNPAAAGPFANGSAGADLFPSTTTGTITPETNYPIWPITYTRIAAGGSIRFTEGGVDPTFTEIAAMCIKSPSGGAAGIQVNGAEVASISTAGSSGVVYPTFTQALAKLSVIITATGGDVLLAFVHKRDSTASGLNVYNSFAQGGLLLANAMLSVANWTAALQALPTLDLLTSHFDDDFGTDAPSAAAALAMFTMWDTVAPLADKVLISGTPRASNDAGKAASDAWLRSQASARPQNYLIYGGYSPLVSYSNMVAQGIQGDGTHAAAKAFGILGNDAYQKLGLLGQMGWHPRPVNNRAAPSYFGAGTRIGAQRLNGGSQADLAFDTAGSVFDWQISAGRSIGLVGTSGTLVAQFSGNVGQKANLLPDNYDVGTVGDARKILFGPVNTRNFFQVKDTPRASGFGGVYAGCFYPVPMTNANAQADYPANGFAGVITYQSDGVTGLGAGNYVANGSAWRKLLAASAWTASGAGPAGSDGYFTVEVNGTAKKLYTYP